MAQAKRKRRSKHRGTPAGTVAARGRTGRKPTGSEGRPPSKDEQRRQRMMRPPTWRGAAIRASLAAMLLLVFTQVGIGPEMPLAQSIAVALFAMALYVPLGYYTDRFVHRRRVAREAAKAGGATKS